MKHKDCDYFESIGICTAYACPGICTKDGRDILVNEREDCLEDTRPDLEGC